LSTSEHEVKISAFPSGQSAVSLEITFEVTMSGHIAPVAVSDGEHDHGDTSLAAAKKKVEALGGSLGIHSQKGATPVFWCRIPVQQPLQRKSAEREHSSGTDAPGGQAKSAVRILMAEDNSINQRVGKLILQKAGFVIDLVADGSEAVEAHRSQPYDMILMDCQMPTMDGFEATRRIRAVSGQQPVIIAVTANALVGERERCLAAGMDDYLSKPFQAEQLVAIVSKWANPWSRHHG
jgi:CheY-like chemotaxis protein